MKRLFVAVLLLCVIGFAAWKKTEWRKPEIPSFTIETRKGQKLHITNPHFDPTSGGSDSLSWTEHFTIHVDYGSFQVRKDLQDINRIEVLDESGNTMKVTDSSNETIEGKRSSKPKEFVFDWIKGQSGKVSVFLPLREVVSITRD